MCGEKAYKIELVLQNWNIYHDGTILLFIRQAANSQCETAGKRCTCQNNQSYLGLTQLHDLTWRVITCQSYLHAWRVLLIYQCAVKSPIPKPMTQARIHLCLLKH